MTESGKIKNKDVLYEKGAMQKYYLSDIDISGKKVYLFLPSDFSFECYRDLHQDLQTMSDDELARHYSCYGKGEGRPYRYDLPRDFQPDSYRLLNADLKEFTDKQLIKHWVLWGSHEKRKYKLLDYKQTHNKLLSKCTTPNDSLKRKWQNVELDPSKVYEADPEKFIKSGFINPGVKQLFQAPAVLVVDYEMSLTGGTSFFYDTLAAHYQKTMGATLLRVRCSGDNVFIFFNGLKIMNISSEKEAKLFLGEHLNKISHIFINSIVGHKDEFIKYILSLPLKKFLFTHDYSIIFNVCQPSFAQLEEANPADLKTWIIDAVDVVYTQNIENIYIISKINGLSSLFRETLLKKSTVVEMPDYFASSALQYEYDTKVFTFGVVGNISDVKGLSLMRDIQNMYRDDKQVSFFNFGENSLGIPSQKYNSVPELNMLLDAVKPNALLFLALWPETFSYTLTLSLLTEIPLFVFDIGRCVVHNRLHQWTGTKNVAFFSDPNDLKQKVLLTKKARFRHIENIVRISSEFDSIFLPAPAITVAANGLDASTRQLPGFFFENVFLVTSKIQVTDVSYNYSKRSKYTINERLLQTLDTIKSVRKYVPDVFIIFIDHSEMQDKLWKGLTNSVDLYINDANQIMRWNCDMNLFKIYGELYQTLFASKVIASCGLKFKNFFKISGRYSLNSQFSFQDFNNESNMFKRNQNVKSRLYYYTSLYKISGKSFDTFAEKLETLYKNIIMYETNADYESMIPLLVDINEVETLGITQYISCDVPYEKFI